MKNKNHHISKVKFGNLKIIGEIIAQDITISQLVTPIKCIISMSSSCFSKLKKIGNHKNNDVILFRNYKKDSEKSKINRKRNGTSNENNFKFISKCQNTKRNRKINNTKHYVSFNSNCNGYNIKLTKPSKNIISFITFNCEAKKYSYTKLKDLYENSKTEFGNIDLARLNGDEEITIGDICGKEVK